MAGSQGLVPACVLLPPLYLQQVLWLEAGGASADGSRPAQFRARFSIKPSPIPTSLSFPSPNSEATGAPEPHLFIHCALGGIPSACHTTSTTVATAVVVIADFWPRVWLCVNKQSACLICRNSLNPHVNPKGPMLFLSSLPKLGKLRPRDGK